MARITEQFRNEINRVLGIELPDSFRHIGLNWVFPVYDILTPDIRFESRITRVSSGTGQIINPIVTNRKNFVPGPEQGQFAHDQVDWIRPVGIIARVNPSSGNIGDMTVTTRLLARWTVSIDIIEDELFSETQVLSPGVDGTVNYNRDSDLTIPITVNRTGTVDRFEDLRIESTWPEDENATITHIVQYQVAIRRNAKLGLRKNIR